MCLSVCVCMHACQRLCMCVYLVCDYVYVCMYPRVFDVYIHACVYMCACMCVVYVCTCDDNYETFCIQMYPYIGNMAALCNSDEDGPPHISRSSSEQDQPVEPTMDTQRSTDQSK